ncbi:phosphoglycerate mutase-like protein [Paraphaeosphaeria sporulosa]|uniref:Phosphoglycerate mutase-like protein n=1 Tax=Paraphaeosphaeria sporulosa TaxID=1460663 RepID=A0A177CF59_9PLEO|nr:phosphoglycerate mutase-like protein [Paraphaeosphaeria sporulosa]OAG05397.1 phosphoglycerate mutase-like protein [Paraphaeosphaeria sporulosa]
MSPKRGSKPLPAGLQSLSTPNLPTLRSPASEKPPVEPELPAILPSLAPRTSPAAPTCANDGNEDEDESEDEDEDELMLGSGESEESQSDEVADAPSARRRLFASRSYSQLPHASSTLYPPFYNRPPVPLPPSPSLTSLLRPSFSTTTSRRTTPDSSDVDVPPGTSMLASTANLASITKSARHAPLVPRASPKVPTYEYYGFALYLASSAAFFLYIVWAYVPSPLLQQMGIHYYPNRWWALAVPCWLVALVVYIYVALASYNTGYLTLPMSSCENLVDEAAQIALVDKRTGAIVRGQPSVSRQAQTAGRASVTSGRRDSISAYRWSSAEKADWKSFWSVSTDAVMDVPIGGVLAVAAEVVSSLTPTFRPIPTLHVPSDFWKLFLTPLHVAACHWLGVILLLRLSPLSSIFTSSTLCPSPQVVKMKFTSAVALASAVASTEAAETVLGAYMFHRHGDRTPKSLAPTNLTALGYEQVYTSGQYYRSRYLTGNSKIKGMNEDIVRLTQLAVTAPVDNVLQNSAQGFLQGLYPPYQQVQTLANGSDVQSPMDGYQLIPINTVETGSGSEDNGWLQDASSCANAKTSSNAFFTSAEYNDLLSKTTDFYKSLVPVVNATFDEKDVSFKNAYVIYDLINVAEIHNSSIPSSDVLTEETLFQLRTLADAHEYGLAYNASDDIRAISGMQLAGEVLKYMNSTIKSGQSGSSANKFGVQFGAYATFLSFFGLVDLPHANETFYGVTDYASSMVFELFTNADTSNGFPATDDLQVRFLFHNGTASNASEPAVYPLFGGNDEALSWNDFSKNLNKFAVHNTEQWCTKCGNTTGRCAQYSQDGTDGSANASSNDGGNHMSAAIGGVIGAMVTLAVVLGALAAFMLLGGFRLAKKPSGARASPVSEVAGSKA